MGRLNRKRYKRILLAVVAVASGALVLVFISYRYMTDQSVDQLFSLPDDTSIALNNVHHTASRNGIMEWQLEAASVAYSNKNNHATFNAPAITFFLDNKEKVTLAAKKGELNTDSNNIKVTDDVIMNHAQYELRTCSLFYDHETRKLYTKAPVRISGDTFLIQADTMAFDLSTNQTVFEGNIRGTFHDTI